MVGPYAARTPLKPPPATQPPAAAVPRPPPGETPPGPPVPLAPPEALRDLHM